MSYTFNIPVVRAILNPSPHLTCFCAGTDTIMVQTPRHAKWHKELDQRLKESSVFRSPARHNRVYLCLNVVFCRVQTDDVQVTVIPTYNGVTDETGNAKHEVCCLDLL